MHGQGGRGSVALDTAQRAVSLFPMRRRGCVRPLLQSPMAMCDSRRVVTHVGGEMEQWKLGRALLQFITFQTPQQRHWSSLAAHIPILVGHMSRVRALPSISHCRFEKAFEAGPLAVGLRILPHPSDASETILEENKGGNGHFGIAGGRVPAVTLMLYAGVRRFPRLEAWVASSLTQVHRYGVGAILANSRNALQNSRTAQCPIAKAARKQPCQAVLVCGRGRCAGRQRCVMQGHEATSKDCGR